MLAENTTRMPVAIVSGPEVPLKRVRQAPLLRRGVKFESGFSGSTGTEGNYEISMA
jgi:hypothetical protein